MIRQHPWFTSMRAVVPKALAERDDTVIKEMILAQLTTLGYDKATVLDAVAKNVHNNVTAAYYLLYGKLVRIMKDRGGSDNKSAFLNAGTAAVASPRANASTVYHPPQQQQHHHARPVAPGSAVSTAPSQAANNVGSAGAMAGVTGASSSPGSSSSMVSPLDSSARRHSTQPPSSKDHAVRAVTPSGVASPRHPQSHHQAAAPASGAPSPAASQPPRRPSSVRSGRNLVLLTNGGAHQPASGAHAPSAPASGLSGVVPVPPRDRRPVGPVASKTTSSGVLSSAMPATNRVSVSNGMVALVPLAHPPHQQLQPHQRSGAPSYTNSRRHTLEVAQHATASPRNSGATASTAATAASGTASGDTSHVITRRRISLHPPGAASGTSQAPTVESIKSPPLSHNAVRPVATTATSATSSKEDDARLPQTANMRIHASHQPQPPSASSRPAPAMHFTPVL